ncbi:MAG: hypothetical protein ACYTBY_06565, partial [Planctomycetota bacterium]|jgi:hypothetical protein
MPAFILTDLTGIQIDLEEQEEIQQQVQQQAQHKKRQGSSKKGNGEIPYYLMMPGYQPPPQDKEEPVPGHDPNKPVEAPVAEPNAPAEPKPAPKPAPKAQGHQDFPTQSLEDQIRAEKLLQSAEMHIEAQAGDRRCPESYATVSEYGACRKSEGSASQSAGQVETAA